MAKITNVLSLFDGLSCGQIALKELGAKVDKYYASEIDKHAIKQTMLNFPDTIQLGSVTDVDVSKLDKIDLLIGGSPCTNFSFAGKRNGMSTTTNEEIYTLDRYLELKKGGFQFEGESFLFWEYMRILNDIRKYNPNVKFLLENVEMGKKWERTLSEAIGLFGVHINSALVSAQNRKRIYWTNIRTKQMGFFGDVYSDIPQPEDRGILLKDILEDEVSEKYYLKNIVVDKLIQHRNLHKELGHGFDAKSHNKDEKMQALNVGGKGIDDLVCIPCDYRHSEGIRLKADGKTGTLLSRARNDESCGQMVCVAMRGREGGEQHLEPQISGKTNTITTVQKDNLVLQINPSKESGGKQPYQHNRVYDTNGISPCLNTDARAPSILTIEDYRIRRLTPTECSRLQTIPEWYRWECSDTQAYKMLGNGWTVEVIKHILQFLEF
jgi:DNA (cytosine-5)-methyltransferase 1